MIAPDLITFFEEVTHKNGKAPKSRYRDTGGSNITLYIPKDFNSIAKNETKQGNKGGSRN
jgi:hypothetical protein